MTEYNRGESKDATPVRAKLRFFRRRLIARNQTTKASRCDGHTDVDHTRPPAQTRQGEQKVLNLRSKENGRRYVANSQPEPSQVPKRC